MNGIAVLVTLAAVGVDYGWQPARDGQLEYIVQIEPSLLESLQNGAEIASEIHPDARGVRRFRIKVGSGPLPRKGTLQNDTAPARLSTSGAAAPPLGSRVLGAPPAAGPQTGLRDADSRFDPSSYSANSANSENEFRADGRLNLPPPPALIGSDGKSSILVRPGNSAAVSPNGNPSSSGNPSAGMGALPPRQQNNVPSTTGTGMIDLAPPPGADGGSSRDKAGQPSGISPPGGGVFPPRSVGGSSFPAAPNNWATPNGDDRGAPPNNSRPVRPIPSPSLDDKSPAPIRSFGNIGARPPELNGPLNRGSTANDNNPALGEGADNGDLMASVAARDAATQKPTIDKQTADELKEMELAKPWRPLVLTSLALFASLAANVYLGWVALGIYRRYRDLAVQLHQAQASLT